MVWPRRFAIANPAPSLPLFGNDWPPVARTTAAARSSPPIRDDTEPGVRSLDVEHAMTRHERRADGGAFAQERVEHVARAVRVRKQLSAGFLVQADADLAEERDRVADGKGAKHLADDGRPAAPEVALGDDGVGDVAARSAADENLGARFSGAVEEDDRAGRIEATDEDGCRQAGRAGADDGDVAGLRKWGHDASGWPRRLPA